MNNMSVFGKGGAAVVAAAWMLLAGSGVQAQALFRVDGAAVEITAADLQADASALDPSVRHYGLADEQKLDSVGKSLAVRASLAQQARAQGLDKDAQVQLLLRQAQDDVLMNALLNHRMDAAEPSDDALLKYAQTEYKAASERFKVGQERKASHILVRGTGDESKAKIDALYKQLQDGADFGQLAFEQSQDPGSAARYGSLGFFGPGKMVPEFDAALDGLIKPGEYAKPFESQFGWHIVRLDGMRDAGVLPFGEVKDALIAEGRKRARIDARDTILTQQMDKVEVDEAAVKAFAEANRKLAEQGRKD